MATPSGPCGNVAVGAHTGVKFSTPTACNSMEFETTLPATTSSAKSCATVNTDASMLTLIWLSVSTCVASCTIVTPAELPSSRTTGVPPPERKPSPLICNVAVCPSCTACGMHELIALVGSQLVAGALPSAGCELGTAALGLVTCSVCTYTFLNRLPGSRFI